MKEIKTIIAITKTEGSGARTVANILVRRYGYVLYSIRDFLRMKFEETYKTPSIHQEELKLLANDIRKKEGSETIIATIFEKILMDTTHSLFIIESVLCVAEIEYLIIKCQEHDIALKLVGITAPVEMRFERLKKRVHQKGVREIEKLKETDAIKYLQVRSKMYIPAILEQVVQTDHFDECEKDPAKINVPACLAMLTEDAVFQNLDGKAALTAEKIHFYVPVT